MALGTRLTLLDYLGTQKTAKDRVADQTLFRGVHPPVEKEFSRILSTCLTGQKERGLTAADYLANPVKVRSEACPEISTHEDGENKERMEKTCDQAPAELTGKNTLNQDQQDTEKTSGPTAGYEDIERSIDRAAQQYDLPSALIRGVIRAESDFQVRAESRAGALGLMQLMPATAKELGVQDPFDIDQNIDAGTRYLKNMMTRFGNDMKKALAAYNAGPGTVEKFGGRVPYRETRQYVERVLSFSGLSV